ncbi:GNAT family N-acetyltransferase [Lachnospiraceae bacterium ZAX-1]
MTNIWIRPINEAEYGILERLLYESLHIPPGHEPFPWDTIYLPEIYVYIKDFGKKDDICFVAETDGQIVGAAYSRILSESDIKGFGYIDDKTPELAISVLPGCRGKGIGRELLDALNIELSKRGYTKISLSVQKTNPALRLYKRVGYKIIKEQETDYLMVNNLRSP